MIKNYFRILKKPHAYLQTILKTPVKFQKDRTETVGGVKGTKYPLKTRNHAPRTTHHAPRATHHAPRATHHAPRTTPHGKPKTVSLHFSSKRRGAIRSDQVKDGQESTFYIYTTTPPLISVRLLSRFWLLKMRKFLTFHLIHLIWFVPF